MSASRLRRASTRASISGQQTQPATVSAESNFRFGCYRNPETWVFKAAEADRSHVEDSIRRAGCDLDTTTDRRGRPYNLVCTKNQASYERRAKQRRQDLKDLALLTG